MRAPRAMELGQGRPTSANFDQPGLGGWPRESWPDGRTPAGGGSHSSTFVRIRPHLFFPFTLFTVFTLYMLSYLTAVVHLPRTLVLSSVTAAALVLMFTVPLASAWSDRVGRRKLFGVFCIVNGIASFPLLWMKMLLRRFLIRRHPGHPRRL